MCYMVVCAILQGLWNNLQINQRNVQHHLGSRRLREESFEELYKCSSGRMASLKANQLTTLTSLSLLVYVVQYGVP